MSQNIRLGYGPNGITLTEETFVTVSRIVEATELDVRMDVTNNSIYVYVGVPNSEVYRYLVYPDGQILVVEKKQTERSVGEEWVRCSDPLSNTRDLGFTQDGNGHVNLNAQKEQ